MVAETLINNQKYIKTANDFYGLQFGKMRPTDIDAFIEFGDRAYIFIETKHTGGSMPDGQRLAIQRLTDIVEGSGRKALALVAEYENTNEDGNIDLAKAVVVEYRMYHTWKIPRVPLNVRDAIDRFVVLATGKRAS